MTLFAHAGHWLAQLLYVAGVAGSVGEGIARAREVLASGAARAKLDQFAETTRRLAA